MWESQILTCFAVVIVVCLITELGGYLKTNNVPVMSLNSTQVISSVSCPGIIGWFNPLFQSSPRPTPFGMICMEMDQVFQTWAYWMWKMLSNPNYYIAGTYAPVPVPFAWRRRKWIPDIYIYNWTFCILCIFSSAATWEQRVSSPPNPLRIQSAREVFLVCFYFSNNDQNADPFSVLVEWLSF